LERKKGWLATGLRRKEKTGPKGSLAQTTGPPGWVEYKTGKPKIWTSVSEKGLT